MARESKEGWAGMMCFEGKSRGHKSRNESRLYKPAFRKGKETDFPLQ
jgi:hypothetical protein